MVAWAMFTKSWGYQGAQPIITRVAHCNFHGGRMSSGPWPGVLVSQG